MTPIWTRHPGYGVVSVMVLMLGLLFGPGSAHAQPPAPGGPWHWVEGIDSAAEREGGTRLSQPLSDQRSVTVSALLPVPAFAADFTHYTTSTETVTFLNQLQAAYPDVVQVSQAGTSWQGRPILAVRLGSQAPGDPDRRPALYLDGQHHAREAIGAQTVLYTLWYLASRYGTDSLVTHLLDTRTVYAIPSLNPDGNDLFLASDRNLRKNASPVNADDDADGKTDEDGPDSAGYGTHDLWRYTFKPEWVQVHPDAPFAQGWNSYLLSKVSLGVFDGSGQRISQLDNDHDGKINEDAAGAQGGVDPNRNYPAHWELGDTITRSGSYRGPAPFSELETRAVRDFVDTHPHIVTAVTYHSGSDTLLHPWGWSDTAFLPDWLHYENMARKGSELTQANGFQGAPHTWTARGLYDAAGSTLDWLYERGIESWAPEMYAASSVAFTQRITATNTYTVGLSQGVAFNPAPEAILASAQRWLNWDLYLLAATPRVSLTGVQAATGALTLTVANDGYLPLSVDVAVTTTGGVQHAVVAGLSGAERSVTLPLPAGALSQTVVVSLQAASQLRTTAALPLQTLAFVLELRGSSVVVLSGRIEPFVALGDRFGGWRTTTAWDIPGQYHLGPPLLDENYLPVLLRQP